MALCMFSELSRLRSCEVRLKRICGYHWIRLVACCPALEADLTKPEFVSSMGAVVLSCIISLIFTSRRLLQTVNDDSILCTFQYQQKAESDEVESLKGWKVLIWMHINALFFHLQFCQSLSLSAPLRFELGRSCPEHLEFQGKRWDERVGCELRNDFERQSRSRYCIELARKWGELMILFHIRCIILDILHITYYILHITHDILHIRWY